MTELPTFRSCYKKPMASLNPLERFIHRFEPGGRNAKARFRDGLTELVRHVTDVSESLDALESDE